MLLSMSASGVLMSSIDNMPAQVPREATDFFGSHLQPYVDEVVSILIDYRYMGMEQRKSVSA